ncbi:MAG TPA: zf-HC2 domain-containing protein [Pyrinomonadaceae bacterium]|nr:zf-HC2 domain-containing protein [Pyrinomonadaceae bacterium]
MDCDKSVELLSDFRDGLLGDDDRLFVDGHLAGCNPCAGIFKDLEAIVTLARAVSVEQEVSFPDEDTFWQRITVARVSIVH